MQLRKGERGIPARWSRHPAGSNEGRKRSPSRVPQPPAARWPAGSRPLRPGWPRSPFPTAIVTLQTDLAELAAKSPASAIPRSAPAGHPAGRPFAPPDRCNCEKGSAGFQPVGAGILPAPPKGVSGLHRGFRSHPQGGRLEAGHYGQDGRAPHFQLQSLRFRLTS
ncbi:MAG: hypothetical protein QOE70_571, partial [Chthoniobacter sp.]|nr:hypothetical protein [Chthoniobacter sp.]